MGISRIILSRELRLDEIKKIKEKVPEIELEAFVHGSVCIAYSGRCLLSHYMSYRDANQGVCDNSCRYPFRMHTGNEYYLQDLRNPTEFYPIDEDEHGTYIMNSKDLCLIDNLKELHDAGVCSFKVEGRTKSECYVSLIAKAYRKAIDRLDKKLANEDENLTQFISNRGYHKGFLFGDYGSDSQNYLGGRSDPSLFAGTVHLSANNEYLLSPRSAISAGDMMNLIYPETIIKSQVLSIYDQNGKFYEKIHPGTGPYRVAFDKKIQGECVVCWNR